MEFTGERYIPGLTGDMTIEHLHRYLLGAYFARDKDVLDIASGEGYGSHILSRVARSVIGVDIDPETVNHARSRYAAFNLRYEEGSATAIPLPDLSVDLVISFETIEHHDQHEAMLAEIKRVLRPGGVMLMSSPDKDAFIAEGIPPNEYHVKELTHTEFDTLLGKHFAHHLLVPQRLVYGSSIILDASSGPFVSWSTRTSDDLDPPAGLGERIFYWLALASDAELPDFAQSFLRAPLEQNGMVLHLTEVLEESRAVRAHLERSVAQLNEEAGTHAALVNTYAALVDTHAALTEAHTALTASAQELDTLNREKSALLEERMNIINALTCERDIMLRSRSWRLTAPLRKASRVARRINALAFAGEAPRWKQLFVNLPVKAIRYIQREGLNAFFRRLWRKLHAEEPANLSHHEDLRYAEWIARFERLSESELADMYQTMSAWYKPPLLSVLMPVYNADPTVLLEAIESVRAQSYDNWELCIADDKSSNLETIATLRRLAETDPRVRVSFREKNGNISHASNTALDMVRGEFTVLMDHDDLLPEHAFYYVVAEIMAHPDVDILYSDEDKIHPGNIRTEPHFKGGWNELQLLSQNYISHLGCYRTQLLRDIGGFRVGFEGSQDHDLVLRAALRSHAERIRHIPHILYHWRQFGGSQSFSDTRLKHCEDVRYRAVQEYMDARGLNGKVERGFAGFCRLRFALPEPLPLVSCIVPTRDQATLTRQCVMGLLHETDYDNIEIIVVDNNSTAPDALALFNELESIARVRVIRWSHPFNYSAINNMAVRESRGELLALINNDIKVCEPGWLKEMVSLALLPKAGAVGAKLLYDDNTVQHAGIMCGMGGVAGHLFCRVPGDHGGYFGRLQITQWVTAVTAACLVVRRDVYEAVGGLEEKLAVAFNDVDFCFKLHSAGFHNTYTPYACLYHLESASRGTDREPADRARFEAEVQFMNEKWSEFLRYDAYFSPHHSRLASDCQLLTPHEEPFFEA